MRKIISFLALLVIAFALPHRAQAMTVYWDNSDKNWTPPHCHYWGGSSASSWPGVNMINVNGSFWSCEIPDNSTGVIFNVGSNSDQTGDLTPVANHVYNSSGDITSSISVLYMYKTTDLSKLGEATIDIPTFTYTYNNIPLTSGDFFVLSGSSDNSSLDKINSNRYSPGDNKDIPGTDIAFSKTTNGVWKATQSGNYNVTVDWANKKLSAVLATDTWDFSGNTNPSAINLSLEGTNPYQLIGMTFADSQWTAEFTAQNTEQEFKFNIGGGWYGYSEGTVSANATGWTEILVDKDTGKYKFTNLTVGTKYKVIVTGNSYNSCNMKIQPATAPWDFSGNTRPSSVKATSVTGADATELTFNYDGTQTEYRWISPKFKATAASMAFKLELSDGTETLILGKDILGSETPGTTSDGNTGTYKQGNLTVGKYYQIEIAAIENNVFKYKVVEVLPDALYLYTNKPAWANKVTASSVSGSVYTFTHTFEQGELFVLSTTDGSTYEGLKENMYTNSATADITVENGVASTFFNSKNNCWKAPVAAEYTITVDWNAMTLTATWTEGPVTYPTLYMYKSKDKTYVEQLASVTSDNGIYTFNFNFTGDTWFVLSTTGSKTKWSDINSTRYSPTGSDVPLPVSGNSFGQTDGGDTSKTWSVTGDNLGNYTITVDWNAKTLTAVKKVVAPWDFRTNTKPKAVSIHLTEDNADHALAFSNGVWSGTFVINSENGSKYIHYYINATDDAGNITKFGNSKGTGNLGAWSEKTSCNDVYNNSDSYQGGITAGKKYKVEVTAEATNEYKVRFTEAVAIPENVYLPLSSLDFEGGKKHYFLVGERQGEWHLQPEWEFKVVDRTNLVLENRFMYNGKFAIGVVDNYADYAMHRYTYYYQDFGFKTGYKLCTSGTEDSFASSTFTVTKGYTMNNPSGVFNSLFDEGFEGPDTDPAKNNYYQGAGTFMTQIKVGLTEAGLPKSIEFVIGTPEESAANRLFTLVGSDIYNKYYCNSSSDGATTHYNSMDGWQEGWIQYDPNTNKPYVDGLGEYLYHTSFTPDYLLTHPVQFNHGTPNGDFSYSSTELQFIKASELSNLATDPYKDFYKSISDNQIVKNGDPRSGNGYNYTIQTYRKQAEDANPTVTPNGTWDCYVVRDMWISGQLKFWSGWGGNDKSTGGGSTAGASGAAWHGPNGGPDAGSVNNHTDVEGFDINAGTEVTLYKNIKNLEANYQVSTDGTPKYFNRVVLWYDNVGGINNSFIQFVQETAGPAIFAQVTTNEVTSSKKNWINYNWYLQNPGTTDTSVKVVGYEIIRYRMDNGVEVFDGYPEGGYVSVADKNVKVSDLLKGSGTMPAWTTFTDKSADAELGFTPGLYRYKITITLDSDGGPTKTATSNQVAIYSDEAVTLQPMALQLVKLSDAGKTELVTTKNYLTYSPSDNATFYAVNLKEVDGEVEIDGTAEEIAGAKALKFLNENPDKYWWTSDYYVRCLDYDLFKAQLQPQVDDGLINAISAPEVVIKETIGDNVLNRGIAQPFEHNGHKYYSLVMKRGGNVAKGTILTTLTYTTTNANGSLHNYESKATLTIDPVLPQPYGLTYGYDYSRATKAVTYEGKQWAKVEVPSGYWNESASKTPKPVYVKLDNNFRPDRLDLNVKFNRPNVVEEIYNKYDIVYGVSLGVKGASSSDLSFTAVDKKTTDNGNPYAITVNGVRPNNEDKPVFNFATTTYEPNATAKADYSELGRNNGTFGAAPSIATEHTITVNSGTGFAELYLGKIEREGSTYDWMYKGHKNFKDAADQLDGSNDNTLCFTGRETIEPLYYLVELKDGSNSNHGTTYEYLVPHIADHYHGTDYKLDNRYEYLLNDSDPLIGTYVAKGFGAATPTLYATAMYLFEQKYEAVSKVAEGYNTVTIDSPAATLRRVNTAPGANPAAGNFGDLPDTGVVQDTAVVKDKTVNESTGMPAYAAVAGATYSKTPEGDMVTGVEDVLADGEGAEAVYYNLQGVRVDNPASAGVYIRVQGKNVSKVVVK